eukprot:maker-scaffold181_size278858-snap-gene-1.31 protein:Tk08513 transcript:maker-scaffold181_size278858-snap-gene-1.31-mRNA-1 annotation:"hypothetical protein DAPPUDRAFT_331880"
MNPKVLCAAIIFVVSLALSNASRMFILDDGEFDQNVRVRRQAANSPFPSQAEFQAPSNYPGPPQYSPGVDTAQDRDLDLGASSYGKGKYKPGKVGPVYTFVKTDYHGNAKWGVRHVVGKKYADLEDFHVVVDGVTVFPDKKLELLGVKFDSTSSTFPHGASVSASARQRAAMIARLSHHLPRGAYLQQLARGLVLGKRAGLSSLNELTVHAVAMETWRAFHSQDGPDGSRNALGQVLFPSNVATRSTRSEAAGVVSPDLPYAANTLVDNGIAMWNKEKKRIELVLLRDQQHPSQRAHEWETWRHLAQLGAQGRSLAPMVALTAVPVVPESSASAAVPTNPVVALLTQLAIHLKESQRTQTFVAQHLAMAVANLH